MGGDRHLPVLRRRRGAARRQGAAGVPRRLPRHRELRLVDARRRHARRAPEERAAAVERLAEQLVARCGAPDLGSRARGRRGGDRLRAVAVRPRAEHAARAPAHRRRATASGNRSGPCTGAPAGSSRSAPSASSRSRRRSRARTWTSPRWRGRRGHEGFLGRLRPSSARPGRRRAPARDRRVPEGVSRAPGAAAAGDRLRGGAAAASRAFDAPSAAAGRRRTRSPRWRTPTRARTGGT